MTSVFEQPYDELNFTHQTYELLNFSLFNAHFFHTFSILDFFQVSLLERSILGTYMSFKDS